MKKQMLISSLLVILFSMQVLICYAEDITSFVYEDHGKRDPFWRLISPSGTILTFESDLLISDVALAGIISGVEGHNVAIINSAIVREGDQIGNFIVSEILLDRVILRKGEETFVLHLKKEE
jgi:hypothetical protein